MITALTEDPGSVSKLSVTRVPRDLMPFSRLQGPMNVYGEHNSSKQTHIHIKINKQDILLLFTEAFGMSP